MTYIANAGFMIERNDKKILIDALFTGASGYQNPSDTVLNKFLSGLLPFDDPNLLLFTHSHPDHFNDSLVIRYLNLNPEAILMAPEGVIRKILSNPGYTRRPGQLIEAGGINQDERDTVIGGVKEKAAEIIDFFPILVFENEIIAVLEK